MKKIKHMSEDLAAAVRNNRVVAASGLLVMSGMANATEPTNYVPDAFAELTAQVNAMFSNAWPLLVLMTVGFIGMKIFKKGANKAT